MIIEINTDSYNEKRYGNPWIAKVDFSDNPKGDFIFGDWIGDAGYAGILRLEVSEHDIIASGQKDHRARYPSQPVFQMIKNGVATDSMTRAVAYKTWKTYQPTNITELATFLPG